MSSRPRTAFALATALLSLLLAGVGSTAPADWFAIEVVDEATGRGVPLIELRQVDGTLHVTDSLGVAAIQEPALFGRRAYFGISGHGYEYPPDGFGLRGIALRVEPGKTARVPVRRLNIAERLYRVTGAGIYRDSILTGRRSPLRQPALNGDVTGSDSAQAVIYHDRLFWIWGDTNRVSYPLGNFQTTGATSRLWAKGGLDPAIGVDLDYFQDETGFARALAPVPGEGPTWLTGLATLTEQGRERLFAGYMKIRKQLEVYERGLVRFDDSAGRFVPDTRFPPDAVLFPHGHAERRRMEGADYLVFMDPYPLVRVAASPEALRNPSRYEAYTCLLPGSTVDNPLIDRGTDGRARYLWRTATPAVGAQDQSRLIRRGSLRQDEALLQLRDPETGKPVTAHTGTVYWNDFRKRWILIAVEIGGTSQLGEVWYAEAGSSLGPWSYARKIVTHQAYSFYNPCQHPEFDQKGGRLIFFEGTYTRTFSGSGPPTPRYEYNQIMYRLDLADPRLVLPFPAAELPGLRGSVDSASVGWSIADRPAPGLIPVYPSPDHGWSLRVPRPGARPVFYALDPKAGSAHPTTVLLYTRQRTGGGDPGLILDGAPVPAGYIRSPNPLCRVWR